MKVKDNIQSFQTHLDMLDKIECPFCGGKDVNKILYQGWFCDGCNAKMEVHQTTGDPGFVIRFDPYHCWDTIIDRDDEGNRTERRPCTQLDKDVGEVCSVVKDHYFTMDEETEIFWKDEDFETVKKQKVIK